MISDEVKRLGDKPINVVHPHGYKTEVGLTKLEWLSGLAMYGFITNKFYEFNGMENLCKVSVEYASCLLEELSNVKK